MRYPKKLEKGATIGIICPSSPISAEREVQCVSVLQEMGFKVKKADNLTKNYAGYMAGTGEERAAWINKMFADKEVDAVFCVRGGDGGSRVIRHLDLDIIRSNPKIFVGYSDVTCLHMLFNQKCDLVTFHGPMVSSNMVDAFDDDTKNAFFDALTAEDTYESVILDAPRASLLGVEPGSCAFYHQRRTRTEDGRIYEYTRSYIRGDRVRLDVHMQKSGMNFVRTID